ncbi:MAG TPA: glycoside hydrolase family 36 protein, partial [Acidimicrobiales bacterium]|nr:glycoside hydrolase family 36 protein [Acidimicrobiales bacterium]
RCEPTDIRPMRRIHPLMAKGCYHADSQGAGVVVSGDQYLLWETGPGTGGAACFLDSREHLSTIEVAPGRYCDSPCEVGPGTSGPGNSGLGDVWAWALMDRIIIEPGQQRALDPLWVAEGEPGLLYSELAWLWGQTAGARIATPSPASPSKPGWCSWYHYWWKVTPENVRSNLEEARKHDFGLMVIDDGYQSTVGDWTDTHKDWSNRGSLPGDLATEIHDAGMQPGIWTAPFLAAKKSKVATEHPEWIVRARYGAFPLPAVYNPVSWHGMVYALDTTQQAVLEHLRETYAAVRSSGFTYHKIDFCYAATMPGRRQNDGIMTRAQGIRAGLQAVRDGIGDDAYLLGCGCPFGPAVGIVDAMRVSPDVSAWWDPTLLKWPAYPDSAPAAINAVRASVLRAPLHRRLFTNDPDCAILRTQKSRLDSNQRQVLADAVAGTGGFVVYSDDLGLYGPDQWSTVDAIRSMGDGLDSPIDIVDPFSKVLTLRSKSAELRIDWGDKPGTPLNAPGWHWSDDPDTSSHPAGVPWSRLSALDQH